MTSEPTTSRASRAGGVAGELLPAVGAGLVTSSAFGFTDDSIDADLSAEMDDLWITAPGPPSTTWARACTGTAW